jgi:hypothetical protein
MTGADRGARTALHYEIEVSDEGRVEVSVPLPAGARVTVLVIPQPRESVSDLTAAAESSLDFWDNPLDDEDWNGAPAG